MSFALSFKDFLECYDNVVIVRDRDFFALSILIKNGFPFALSLLIVCLAWVVV
mgnify:CR=1 FL=1